MTSVVVSIGARQLPVNLRRVRKWSSTGVMAEAGFDVNQIGSSNFQAVKTYAKGVGFGGVTSFLRIPRAEVAKLEAMQIPDEYTAAKKMEWLCSYRGSIYLYENEGDAWQTAPNIKWGTITLGGNLVQVEGYEDINVGGEVWRMARLAGFRRTDWAKPLDELIATGLVHRCYCAYQPNNGFGDSPKGTVYSPFFSPKDYDFAGNAQPENLYLPEKWLEPIEPGLSFPADAMIATADGSARTPALINTDTWQCETTGTNGFSRAHWVVNKQLGDRFSMGATVTHSSTFRGAILRIENYSDDTSVVRHRLELYRDRNGIWHLVEFDEVNGAESNVHTLLEGFVISQGAKVELKGVLGGETILLVDNVEAGRANNYWGNVSAQRARYGQVWAGAAAVVTIKSAWWR